MIDDTERQKDRLFEAVTKGDFYTTQKIVEAGVSVNILNAEGKPLLEVAITASPMSMENRVKIVDLLIKPKANVNCVNPEGLSPLYYACKKNFYTIALLLITAKADVNVASHLGMTALHAAAWGGSWELIGLLLKHGANKNAANRQKRKPIDSAISAKRPDDILKLLKVENE